MKLLAIETATEACSAALLIDGEILERHEIAPQQHAELLLGMVDHLLGQTGLSIVELDAIAFGQGPGSFTGLRIAAGGVQGLAFGAGVPAVPVSTLQVLAQTVRTVHGVDRAACAFDARMGEVYWGLYEVGAGEEGVMQPLGPDEVSAPDEVSLPAQGEMSRGGWVGAGSGWSSYGDALTVRLGDVTAIDHELKPRAGILATLGAHWLSLGRTVPAHEIRPVYLRNQVTRAPRARRA